LGIEPGTVTRIDINCDMGEGAGNDAAMLPWITSANIACGVHAGGPALMRLLVRACKERGVAVGAHPGLHDMEGFGRREIAVRPDEAYDLVVYQTGALLAFATAAGVRLAHVKPHGALYNVAARDRGLADAIAGAVRDVDNQLVLFGLAGSELITAGERAGIVTAAEAFADRNYMSNGSLVSRDRPDAFVHDPAIAADRVLRMLAEGRVAAVDGRDVPLEPSTICIHGDGPNAVEMAREVRSRLDASGIIVSSLARHGDRG
jgi:5-oxoprolinase (ATP-hydrolysing) subunit A